jgi:Uma2 family endonuclease
MATVPRSAGRRAIDYPTSDGKPMAETEVHRDDMMDLIRTLQDYFANDPMVCVSGNMLRFYEEGNRNRHVSPDVFVVMGVPRRRRENYLIWEEGRAPDFVIELTSKSTRAKDETKQKRLYQNIHRVTEYILFDPKRDYLKPPLQGHRLVGETYVPIELVDECVPSQVLGLHFGRDGEELRIYEPATGRRLPTRGESAELAKADAERAAGRAERAEAELERSRREIEELRRKLAGGA